MREDVVTRAKINPLANIIGWFIRPLDGLLTLYQLPGRYRKAASVD